MSVALLLWGALAAGMQAAPTQAYADIERLESNVRIQHVARGSGALVSPAGTVVVRYRGRLLDGTVFDNSLARGEPATFSLNSVIPCWQEGIARLRVGAKAVLICPGNTAYGERGMPPAIPPNSTLVFEVQVIHATKH